MPEMSGPDAVRLMKEMWKPGDHACTFVCVSAYSPGGEEDKMALEAGFDLFEGKPLSTQALT